MFSGLKRIFGNVTVEQRSDTIFIEGVRAEFIEKDIVNYFGGRRVTNNMFDFKTHSFSLPSFFCPDFLFTVERLMDSGNSLKVSINTLNKIRKGLLENTWLKDVNQEPIQRLDRSKLKLFKLTPLDYQTELFDNYEKATYNFHLNGYLFAASAGLGKAQPLDALIKVPNGWVKMGDMKVGSEVIAKDGTTTKVIGVFPQGKKEIFKITFADGRSTECCEEHLWTITRTRGHDRNFRETVSTKQLIEYKQISYIKNRLYIDLPESEKNDSVELPIDPYLLGVFLGDGCARHMSPSITTPDEFIVEEIKRLLPKGNKLYTKTYKDKCPCYVIAGESRGLNPFKMFLIENNLIGKYSYNKTIPEQYLHASTEQRLALLQGLLDTDGTITTDGTASFCSTSEDLALGVQYLVRSLGGICSIATRFPHYTHNGEYKTGRLAYQVNIRYKKQSDLFRLPKKKERTNDNNQYAANLRLRIESIESIGFKEAQCIAIEHPEHLYVTDQFIVTHNTATALMLAECLEADKVIIISPKNALHKAWKDNIVNHFKEIPSYWISDGSKPFTGKEKYIVVHYEYLGKLLEQLHLMRFNQPFVVLDESHNFNEIKSNRTGLFLDLCNQLDTQDILMLSGTPIKATALESIPLLRALDPSFTEDVEKRFRAIFKGDNTKAVEILSNRLGQMTFKVAKDKSNLEKPIFKSLPVSFNGSEKYTLDTIKVKMREFIVERNEYYKSREKEDKKFFQDCLDYFESITRDKETLKLYGEYQIALKKVIQSGGSWDAKDEMIFCNRFENKYIIPVLRQEDRAKFKSVKSLIKYRSLVIQGECLGRIVGRARIDCHVDMCKYIDFASICESTHKKTLVFTSFTEVAVATVNSLTDKEFNPLIVYAKTNHDLKNIVERFYKDQNANPLVATYASLSTAVPITCANVVVMIDTPFRDYIMNQAISRTHRLGQDSQVYVYTAVLDTQGKPNISTRTVDILKWSQQQTEEILNIKSPFKLEDVGGLEVSVEAYVHKLEEDCVVTTDLIVKTPSFKDW